jgi:hypothetical protein
MNRFTRTDISIRSFTINSLELCSQEGGRAIAQDCLAERELLRPRGADAVGHALSDTREDLIWSRAYSNTALFLVTNLNEINLYGMENSVAVRTWVALGSSRWRPDMVN